MGIISPVASDGSGNQSMSGNKQVMGKDDFLQLLVTKLRYQDPLNPLQDEDFAAQLAQFSSLEQMQNISDGIAQSNQWDLLQMQSLNNAMASGFIGREIEANYDTVYVDNSKPATISFTLPDAASQVTLTIKDSDGNVVRTITEDQLSDGAHELQWDAKDTAGNTVPDGTYTVEASAKAEDGTAMTPKLSLIGVVESVLYRDGSAYMHVNGIDIPLGDITAVAEPGELD
jgi:flagellar basal-body rod modification protein FlgD